MKLEFWEEKSNPWLRITNLKPAFHVLLFSAATVRLLLYQIRENRNDRILGISVGGLTGKQKEDNFQEPESKSEIIE